MAALAAPIGPVLSGNFHLSYWADGLRDRTTLRLKKDAYWAENHCHFSLIGLSGSSSNGSGRGFVSAVVYGSSRPESLSAAVAAVAVGDPVYGPLPASVGRESCPDDSLLGGGAEPLGGGPSSWG